jgi:DNA polymerase-3 subunit delta
MTAKKKPKGVSLDGTQALDELERLDPAQAAGVYVVYGKERYLVDRAISILRDKLLDPRTRDFNYELFQGKDTKADRIVNAARTLPMMAARRLVMVRDLDAMKAEEQNKLIPFVEEPSPDAVLVLEGEKLDQRTKLGQTLKKLAVCIKLEPIYERHLIGFVRTEAKRRKLVLDTGAGELLCEEIGADLGALADTVERLALWSQAHDNAKVTARDVEAQVPGGRQRTVFELADAVGKGDRARSLTILSAMMDGKESGVRVVAMLARHVRQLWSADGLAALHHRREDRERAAADR